MAQWCERLPPSSVSLVRFWRGSICELSLLLVLDLLPGIFFSWFSGNLVERPWERGWFSGFPPSTKTSTANSSSTRIENPHDNQLRLMSVSL